MTDVSQRAGWREWIAVATLGVASFAIVTTELAPIGLLSQIGGDLDRPPQQVGLVVTLYAWIAAGAALVSVVTLGRAPRRPLLAGLLVVLAVSAGASAMAESFGALMVARVVGAIAHGAFWAMIGTLGAQLVPPRQVGLATSIIFGGVSAASVIGVPLANAIGLASDWRTAFAAIGVLAVVVALAVLASVPTIRGGGGIGAGTLVRIARDQRFSRIFVATLLAITAHFMAFTYVEPYLGETARMAPAAIAPLLFAFGAAGIAANVLTGALIDGKLKAILVLSLVAASGSLLALGTLGPQLGIVGIAAMLVLWGGAVAAILVGFQTWILKEAGADALPASAIYVALFNGSIGLGAMVGAFILDLGGLASVYAVAAGFTVAGLAAIAMMRAPAIVPAE
ncbi:MFS transporter [Salinarimonas ramus]|uniref:MFS transporter n=1 Tax=Salinarimonas ramus TaxID=690164 RepID=A0A917Q6K6_9HYPH|nr:MFS transporter [Salinarimonas ramus]GGK30798.1 MFS transporter [Salinarimonas ramus]